MHALLQAIRSSPIIVQLRGKLLGAAQWARIRKSTDVDAYVLAWIASHVPERSRRILN